MRYLDELSDDLVPGDTVRLRVRRDGVESELRIVAEEGASAAAIVIGDGPPVHIQLDSLGSRVRVLLDSARVMLDTLELEIPEFAFERSDSAFIFRFDGKTDTILFHDSMFAAWDSIHGAWRGFDFDVHDFTTWRVFMAHAVAGAEFEELNPDLAEYFDSEYGVLVVDVSPGTPADRAGFEPGDVVVSAAGEPVRSVDDLRSAIMQADENVPVRIEIIRHGARTMLELEHE